MATLQTLANYPFLQMLMELPVDTVSLVYKSVPSTLFTINMIDSSARDLINFLMTTPPISLRETCNPKTLQSVKSIVDLLNVLKIVHVKDGLTSLCPNFRMSYLSAITQRQSNSTRFERLKESREKFKKFSVTELFAKGNDRWDLMLKYLISPINSPNNVNISNATVNMFVQLGYLKSSSSGQQDITSKGFQFLLQSKHAQIWHYLSAYLRRATKESPHLAHDIIEVFCSLVMLAPALPCTTSKSSYFVKSTEDSRIEVPYRLPNVDPLVNEFFMHMRELGFIFIRKRKDGCFYITPQLSMLRLTGSAALDAVILTKVDGYLIAESNYRVYAYTNDQLQLSILNTFTETDGAFADMVMSIITRNSVRRAFELGITAAQIVAFMRSNSHPVAIEKFGPTGCVPQTIVDQIELWELERRRFSNVPGILYTQFNSQNELHRAAEYAKKNNIFKWQNIQTRQLIIDAEGHEMFKQWWLNMRQRTLNNHV